MAIFIALFGRQLIRTREASARLTSVCSPE
jgi:hypothetical protein